MYEGQIFVITRSQLLKDVLHVAANDPAIKEWGEKLNGVFLLGGTFGGILFGWLADRFGRRPMMALTILTYSLFAGLTFFAQTLWQVAALRFLVALGVGGEWAVAASLVAAERKKSDNPAKLFPRAADSNNSCSSDVRRTLTC